MDLETNLAKDFADAIRRGRMQHRMSQRLLAKAADVSQSTVCRLEQGDLRVSVGALVNVLTALGMELLTGGVPDVEVSPERDQAGRLKRRKETFTYPHRPPGVGEHAP